MISLSLAMSITPGPVNVIAITSGINNGFKKTLPFVSGAAIGFTTLLICVGFGFISIINTYPIFLNIISVFGSLFIIYLGYKIISSNSKMQLNSDKIVPKFYEGFLLQWFNPKAWIACIAGTSIFSHKILELITFIIIYFIICYSSITSWALFGHHATKLLNNDIKLKLFNYIMGVLLIFPTTYFLIDLLNKY
jgi:threonine/homoserine/homoserine lactone efflux protein